MDGTVVGKPSSGITEKYVYDLYPIDVVLSGSELTALTIPGTAASDVIARSNPSRPVITPLTLAQDMIELPAMLRNIGSLLTKPARILSANEIANQNLAFQFGWLPLVQDVRILLDLQSHILRKVKELRRLYDGVGLRKHVPLLEDTSNRSFTTRFTVAVNQFVDVSYDVTVKKKCWGSIHWKPTTVPPGILQDEEMNRVARKIVLGLTPEGLVKGAWDLIPWTWLLAWFSDIGNFMLLYNNTIPASHSLICLMNEIVATSVPGRVTPIGVATCDIHLGGAYIYTAKLRVLSGGVVPSFNMPFISMFRLSILGSLFTQRFMR